MIAVEQITFPQLLLGDFVILKIALELTSQCIFVEIFLWRKIHYNNN